MGGDVRGQSGGGLAEADPRAGLTRTVLRQLALVQKSGGSVKLVA